MKETSDAGQQTAPGTGTGTERSWNPLSFVYIVSASMEKPQQRSYKRNDKFAKEYDADSPLLLSHLPRSMFGFGIQKAKGMRVVFVHPDLGIGGAEKLIVNAALSLNDRGHDAWIYTTHHEDDRCFEETSKRKHGRLAEKVVVRGDFLPRTIFGRLHVVCAIARMVYASFVVVLETVLFPRSQSVDVIICDLVSHVVPILRLSGAPVLFYCHYPDKLLCIDRGSLIKRLYRKPIDWLEEKTTGASQMVVVNSKFTAQVFHESFTTLSNTATKVLYPAIDLKQFDRNLTNDAKAQALKGLPETLQRSIESKECILLSVNRFERKKNLGLAVEALDKLMKGGCKEKIHLVLAGGYDPRLEENVSYAKELQALAQSLGLEEHVSFVRSFSDDQRLVLMEACRCVLYTPDKEHFGIVPIEAMYACRPVVAVASGGPLESVVHEKTGYLEKPDPDAFAKPLRVLVEQPDLAAKMGRAGKEHVAAKFSLDAFGESLEDLVLTLHKGPHPPKLGGLVLGFLLSCAMAILSIVIVSLDLA